MDKKKDIQKIWFMCRHYAEQRGFANDAEDFAQIATMKIINGKRASLSNMFIDFVREKMGRHPSTKKIKAQERFFYEEICEKKIVAKTDKSRVVPMMDVLKDKNRVVFGLKFIFGFEAKEIAWLFNVKEELIWFWLSEIKKVLISEKDKI